MLLITFGLLNLSVWNSIVIISISIISNFFSLFILIRSNTTSGITEDGLFVFGETYNWSNIKKCCIDKKVIVLYLRWIKDLKNNYSAVN